MTLPLVLKLLGAAMLACAGFGAGVLKCAHLRKQAESIRCFVSLLLYMSDAIHYRALPGPTVLAMAARNPAFAQFALQRCRHFSELPVPPALGACQSELREGLRALESAGRESACRTLAHLTALCRAAEQQARQAAAQARALYPRLGACLGLLGAILLL